MAIRGITRRWLKNSLSLILVILFVLVLSFSFFVRSYFYSGVQQTLKGRSKELVNAFSGYNIQTSEEFNTRAREYIEDFTDKEMMELMAFDSEDKIIVTSTGFMSDENEEIQDYNLAKASDSNFGMWTGKLSSGEPVMAITRCIYSSSGDYLGAVRYIVSLKEINKKTFFLILLLIIISALVVMFVIMSGLYFIKSIVNPVGDIGATAKKIAQGDFNAKIDKKYDDEIGELCDTINYMACELGVAEKMKNDFISSVSHELRTPLTAIKGWAETMREPEIDKQMLDKGMNIIVHEAERLSGIVEELLDFSRMQNGRMVLMMDRIDILAELDEAVYMFRERAASEGKNLSYDEPGMVSPVLGDKNRLRQVFINIIDNALKYTPKDGTIIIRVEEDEEKLRIIVEDNGKGISTQHLPRVKDKFYKADQTQRGSGIGLAVADEIMALHSGSLDISSEEGVGTKVTISIPTIHIKRDDE